MDILGISCFYHDSAAALIRDGEIVAAAQEERFTRKKHTPEFPTDAINFCLEFGKVNPGQLAAVVFYDKPLLKFERIVESYLAIAPKGFISFLTSIPVWLRGKLWMRKVIKKFIPALRVEILFTEHHEAHAG